MKVDVRFFASLREATGVGNVALELPDGAGFEALMAALAERLGTGALGAITAENVRIARNQELVVDPSRLADGDEIAFLPPVTGG